MVTTALRQGFDFSWLVFSNLTVDVLCKGANEAEPLACGKPNKPLWVRRLPCGEEIALEAVRLGTSRDHVVPLNVCLSRNCCSPCRLAGHGSQQCG